MRFLSFVFRLLVSLWPYKSQEKESVEEVVEPGLSADERRAMRESVAALSVHFGIPLEPQQHTTAVDERLLETEVIGNVQPSPKHEGRRFNIPRTFWRGNKIYLQFVYFGNQASGESSLTFWMGFELLFSERMVREFLATDFSSLSALDRSRAEKVYSDYSRSICRILRRRFLTEE